MRALAVLGTFFVASAAWAQNDAAERWVTAAGGRERLAAIQSVYREATIDVAGHTGSIRIWRAPDGRYRKEEQIAAYSLIETFDGETGMIQMGDEAPRRMTQAELARARSTSFANFAALFFVAFPEYRRGELAAEGDGSLVLRPEGGVDWRVIFRAGQHLPHQMIHVDEIGRTIQVTFTEFETVDGVTLERSIQRTMGEPGRESTIRFTRTTFNEPLEPSMFSLPAQ